MVKYFSVQGKRLLRYLPGALLIALLLLIGIGLAFQLILNQNANSDQQQRVQIAVSGQTDDVFLQMGLSALNSFDNSRFAMELIEMDTDSAKKALARGEIAAYIVIPEGFMDAAFRGEVIPLDFVSTTGSADLISIFKEELGTAISNLLVYSQKGVFGLWDAMHENGLDEKLPGQMDALSLVYVDYILARDNVYKVQELGISDALGFEQYLICGLAVLLLLLICLPFASAMINNDPSLGRMLQAKGISAIGQALCEYVVFAAMLVLISAVLIGSASIAGIVTDTGLSLWDAVVCILPVLFVVTSFSFMLYSFTGQMISGILLHFFMSLAMCFVSGCMYPVYFFPSSIQRLAAWLPTGLARTQLSACFTGAEPEATLLLLGYSLVFLCVGIFLRRHRIKEVVQR